MRKLFALPPDRTIFRRRNPFQTRLSSSESGSRRIRVPFRPITPTSALPTTPSCPPPTCACRTPPPSLEIDRESPLAGTAPRYSKHLVICTGHSDWPSRIEDSTGDDPSSTLVRGVKALLGRDGKFRDPFNNILTSFSSFTPESSLLSNGGAPHASAYILPSLTYFPRVPTDPAGIEHFVREHLLPSPPSPTDLQAHPVRDAPDPPSGPTLSYVVTEPLVLICGHGSRDSRCGSMAPVLQQQLEDVLGLSGNVVKDHPHNTGSTKLYNGRVQVGLVSHVGGHKWAGNVLLYIPPNTTLPLTSGADSSLSAAGIEAVEPDRAKIGSGHRQHPLAGMGVWYGRVEPRHVEGIIAETIRGGRVVQELFRGGIGANGEYLG